MTITLPDERKDELERKARAAGFDTILNYLLSLVPDDATTEDESDEIEGPPERSPKNRAELEAMLDAGMRSGPPIRMTPEFWEERRRVQEERIAKRKGGST